MKKRIAVLAGALALAFGVANAEPRIFSGSLVSDTGIAYDQTHELDLAEIGTDKLSFQAVYSSRTFAPAAWTDGQVSTVTITVSGITQLSTAAATNTITVPADTDLAAKKATNKITLVFTSTPALVGQKITLRGREYTEGVDWHILALATQTANSIATALNASSWIDASWGEVTTSTVIFATATVAGIVGNTYTLTSSTPTLLTVNSATFTGGAQEPLEGAWIEFQGRKLHRGTEWQQVDTASGTATSIAAALTGRFTEINASAAGRVVYATATVGGSVGNSYTLKASTVALALGGATFSGGRDNASVTINGVTLTNRAQWTVGANENATAKAISDAIMANPALSAIIRSTHTAAVVYATSTAVGANTNYTVATSTPELTVSHANMFGGKDSAVTLGSGDIRLTGHGLTTATDVLYTKGGSVDLAPLVAGTTYFAINVNPNLFRLATTSTGAVAGSFITFTSSSVAGPNAFTATPLGIDGSTATVKWEMSNDRATWFEVDVASINFVSPYTAGTKWWTLTDKATGRYLRLNVTAPATGALELDVQGYGR